MNNQLPYKFKGPVNFSRCLVRTTPTHGWAYPLVINGVVNTVSGVTPTSVFEKMKEALEANVVSYEDKDLWATLNLSWMMDISSEHHSVSLEDFLGYIEPTAELETSEKTKAIWNILEVFLARLNYSWEEMQSAVRLTREAFSQAESPSIGDPGRHFRFSKEVSSLYKTPIYTRQKAREWYLSTRIKVDNGPHTPTLW